VNPAGPQGSVEQRVIDACKTCCERWGMAKVTVDDIASEAGISRATLYRFFPGGKDVLFEAMRRRETTEFFEHLIAGLDETDTLEDLVVAAVSLATRALRDDEHLQLMLASEPGEVLADLTVAGLPRIVAAASSYLVPVFTPYLDDDRASELAEWLSRLVISFFLAPSSFVDLGDDDSARHFIRRFVLPAFQTAVHTDDAIIRR
jgi:AcrR family transcriptional regulator